MLKLIRRVVVLGALSCLWAGTLSAQFDPEDPLAGSATFVLDGTDGDYITGGETLSGGPDDGTWYANANIVVPPSERGPRAVRIHFESDGERDEVTGVWWDFEFSVREIPGAILAIGSFEDAQRASFAEPGHPGLDITGTGRGCNTIAGEFQITAFSWDCLPDSDSFHLRRFAATFEQHCEAGESFLRGSIDFTAPPSGVPCSGAIPGDGDGDTPTPPPPPPPPPFQVDLPAEFAVNPVVISNNSSRTIQFNTSVDTSRFTNDLHLSVISDASPSEDFSVELTPSMIAAPGAGPAELVIRTGPMTVPRTYTVTILGVSGEEVHGSSLRVEVECTPPHILGIDQPANVTAPFGTDGLLQTKVSGSGPFVYQWYRGFPGMTRDPVPTTGPQLSVPSGSGSYWVRVRNACGSFDSQIASVNP